MLSSKLPQSSGIMTVMTKAAFKASKRLLRDFGELEKLQVSRKDNHHFVSSADLASNRIITSELQNARPDYGVLSEEHEEIVGTDHYRWIVDPLDGTVNFLHGFHMWAISIALQDTQTNQVIAGIVYSPVNNEMFWAEKGNGAFLNDIRIRVAKRRRIKDSIVSFSKVIPQNLHSVNSFCAGARKIGSAALSLAYVASGRMDAFFFHSIPIWDFSAGGLLVREAGGITADQSFNSCEEYSSAIVATNIDLLPEISQLMR